MTTKCLAIDLVVAVLGGFFARPRRKDAVQPANRSTRNTASCHGEKLRARAMPDLKQRADGPGALRSMVMNGRGRCRPGRHIVSQDQLKRLGLHSLPRARLANDRAAGGGIAMHSRIADRVDRGSSILAGAPASADNRCQTRVRQCAGHGGSHGGRKHSTTPFLRA